jgi:hypothetical protein
MATVAAVAGGGACVVATGAGYGTTGCVQPGDATRQRRRAIPITDRHDSSLRRGKFSRKRAIKGDWPTGL